MNKTASFISAVIAFYILTACAQLGGREGGGDSLPNRGITNYESAALGDPPSDIVLAPPGSSSQSYGEPSAIVYQDQVHLYVHAVEWNGEGSILLFVSQDNGKSFTEPSTVAEAPTGTSGILSSPSVSCIDNTCILGALAGNPAAIYIADGPPQGPFVWRDSPAVEATEDFESGGISSPSVILEDTQIRIYYTTKPELDAPTSIAGGTLNHSNLFEKWGVIVAPGRECLDSSGLPASCWNEVGNREPEVKIALTGTGRTLYRMLFTGTDGNTDQVGFAASWDGETFESYAFNPIFDDGKTQVSNIRVGDSYLLYYVPSATWDAGKIGLAVNEQGNATESF